MEPERPRKVKRSGREHILAPVRAMRSGAAVAGPSKPVPEQGNCHIRYMKSVDIMEQIWQYLGMQRKEHRRAQNAILEVADRHRGVIDVRKQALELEQAAPGADFISAARRLRESSVLHTLQNGRWLVNTDGKPTRFPRVESLSELAGAALGRLEIDYYVSWHSALWHHGLVDQQSSRLYVAVLKRKRNARLKRFELRFVTVDPRKFFGFEEDESFDAPVPVATVEKALLDCFDQPRYTLGIPVLANALRTAWVVERLDVERLVAWAIRLNQPTLNRRLGFFLEFYEIPGAEPLLNHLGRGWAVPLAPGAAAANKPRVNHRWLVFEDPEITVPARSLR